MAGPAIPIPQIPIPQIPNKTIILCFDGTTDQYGCHNSNIAKLYMKLDKSKPDRQVTYYQAGIGQYYPPGSIYQLIEPLCQVTDWAFGWSLNQHVIDGYRFLVQNWREGDRVLIFGFSRGSYVARCVAGMVDKVGLLAKDNNDTLVAAYRLYQRTDKMGIKLAKKFKHTFSHEVTIDFVGVFDTVAAIGLFPMPALPFSSTNNDIKVFRQAFALDEHRSRFHPSPYEPDPPKPGFSWNSKTFGFVTFVIPSALVSIISLVVYFLTYPGELLTWIASLPAQLGAKDDPDNSESNHVKHKHEHESDQIKEVWFVGCHEDVGGSAVMNDQHQALADITLRWMVGEIIAKDDPKIPVLWRNHDTVEDLFCGKEIPKNPKELDDEDALLEIHDELSFPTLLVWLGLELLPDIRLYNGSGGTWLCQLGINFGRGRLVHPSEDHSRKHETASQREKDSHIWVHETVFQRHDFSGYVHKAVFTDPKKVKRASTIVPPQVYNTKKA